MNMKAAAIAIVIIIFAMFLLTAIPASATSKTPIPYIEIESPEDGSTVGTQETLLVVAEGRGLRDPSFSVQGEHMGFAGPLTNCYYTTADGKEIPVTDLQQTAEQIEGYGPITSMYCKQELNLNSFEGQNIVVSASVYEGIGAQLSDSVGLYVVGDCA